ncbi:hypothetical protein Ddye_011457 [Dipteronia dyeriana]|uniref:RHOMBOID-like protein n=1 Tax=Dipteronia dyeriana TaxID=168575 RepID=A0AAD9X2I7_9ROSI|nr:hypothetical protein Ddye_011457 [Dipteronia dyeriana]
MKLKFSSEEDVVSHSLVVNAKHYSCVSGARQLRALFLAAVMGKMSRVNDEHDVEARRSPSHPPPPPLPEPWCSWLVPLIFLACVALFIHSMHFNDCPSHIDQPEKCFMYPQLGKFSFQPMYENPLIGPSTQTLRDLGGLDRRLIVENGEKWRLLSCLWLHAGVIHLVANMLSLLLTGFRLEQEFGFLRIGVLYVFSGLGGSLLSCLHQDQAKPTISVGASGALFGLLGSMLSELITNWTIYANKCVALTCLLFIIALNLALGFLPNVDNSAHIGGFLAGFFLGFIVLVRPQYGYVSKKHIPAGYDVKKKKTKYKLYQHVLCLIALLILIAGYAVGMSMLYKGERVENILLSTLN